MASSSYYYGLYRSKRREAEDYEDDLKDLRKILSNLSYELFDDILDVNHELEGLIADLKKGIRHNSRFTSSANAFENEKEKSVERDRDLSSTQNALEDEVARVKKVQSQAYSDSSYYYRKYEEALAAEKAAAAAAKDPSDGGE